MIAALTFIFVMVVTAILFGSWVVVSVCRIIWSAISGSPRPMQQSSGKPCGNPGCRAGNPVHAQYCRRCGANLVQPIPARSMNQPRPRFNPSDGRGNGRGNGQGRQVARI